MPKGFLPVRFLFCLLLFASPTGAAFPPPFLITLPQMVDKGQQHFGFVIVDKHRVLLRVEALCLRSSDRRSAADPMVITKGHGRFAFRLPFENYAESHVGLGVILRDCSKSVTEAACLRRPGPVISHSWSRVGVRQTTPLLLLLDVAQAVVRAGQLLQFRAVVVRAADLLPVPGSQLDAVLLESPTGEVVAEWRNVSWAAAMRGFAHPLTRAATPGSWAISASAGGQNARRRFRLEPPTPTRLLVEPKPPEFLRADAKFADFVVCARASDSGLPVRGHVTTVFCVRSKRYPVPEAACVKSKEEFASQDACVYFKVPTRRLGLTHRGRAAVGPPFTFLKATVTEKGRRASVTEAVFGGPVIFFAFSVRLDLPRSFFRPGLPFYGSVRTTSPNGHPFAHGRVRIELRPLRGPGLLHADLLTTDEEGSGSFAVPPAAMRHLQAVVVRAISVAPSDQADQVMLERWSSAILHSAPSSGEAFQLLKPLPGHFRTGPLCAQIELRLRLQSNTQLFGRTAHILLLGGSDVTDYQTQTILGRRCYDRNEDGLGHFRCARKRGDGPWLARCLSGWSGPDCLSPRCSEGCVRGVCVRPEVCVCEQGWSGRACNWCRRHRRCRHGYCHRGNDCACLPGWAGPFCDRITFKPVYNILRPAGRLLPKRVRYPRRRWLQRISLFQHELRVRFRRPLGNASFLLVYLSRTRGDGSSDWLSAGAKLGRSAACALHRTEASFAFEAPVVRPGAKVRAKVLTDGMHALCALALRDVRSGPLQLASDLRPSEVLRRLSSRQMPEPKPEKECEEKAPVSSIAGSGFQLLGNAVTNPCWNYSDPSGWWRCEEDELDRQRTWDRGDDLAAFDQSLKKDAAISEEAWEQPILAPLWQPLWLFKTIPHPDSVMQLQVPHSTTTWESSFVCLSSHGLAIAAAASLVVYQPFQVKVRLPRSLRSGETLVLPVYVRSYDAECLHVRVRWLQSERVKLHSYARRTMCVCEFSQKQVNFTITPKDFGNVSITVETTSQTAGPGCEAKKNGSEAVTDTVHEQLVVLRSKQRRLRSMSQTETDFKFQLKAAVVSIDSNCSRRRLRLCPQPRGASIRRVMLVLKAQMASGWQVIPSSVKRLRNQMRITGLHRITVNEDDTLVLFYNFLSTFKPQCAQLDMLKLFVVADLQPMRVKAFELSHPDASLSHLVPLHTKMCPPLTLQRKHRKTTPAPPPTKVPKNCPRCHFDKDYLLTLLTRACELSASSKWRFLSARYSSWSASWFLQLLKGRKQLRWPGALLLSRDCPCHLSRQLLLIGTDVRIRSGAKIHLDKRWHVIDLTRYGEEIEEISESGLCRSVLELVA